MQRLLQSGAFGDVNAHHILRRGCIHQRKRAPPLPRLLILHQPGTMLKILQLGRYVMVFDVFFDSEEDSLQCRHAPGCAHAVKGCETGISLQMWPAQAVILGLTSVWEPHHPGLAEPLVCKCRMAKLMYCTMQSDMLSLCKLLVKDMQYSTACLACSRPQGSSCQPAQDLGSPACKRCALEPEQCCQQRRARVWQTGRSGVVQSCHRPAPRGFPRLRPAAGSVCGQA